MSEYIYATDGDTVQNMLSDVFKPLQEVVRCRDCDYYDHWEASGCYREKHVCGHWDYLEIEPNGFCAWAERKD